MNRSWIACGFNNLDNMSFINPRFSGSVLVHELENLGDYGLAKNELPMLRTNLTGA